MKNLITAIGCLMILLTFVLQFAENQMLHNTMTGIDQEINRFKETIKQEGCISKKNENMTKEKISKYAKCKTNDVKITGDESHILRGGEIHYKVVTPVKGIIKNAVFFGIKNENNRFDYVIDRYTTSEYIGR